MQKLTFLILALIFSTSVSAQNEDNEECRKFYNAEKFEEAYQCYAKDDEQIFSVYMAAYLSAFLEYKKEYKKHYKHLLSDNFASPEQFYYAANLYPKNSKKHVKILNKGLKKYESDTLLLRSKIEYYVKIKDYNKALETSEQYGSQTSDLYISLRKADIYRLQEKYMMAVPLYQKAIELDKENYAANYWIGMLYHDRASAILLLMDGAQSDEEADKMEKEALSLLKKALPHLELVYKRNPESELKSALLTCYKRLGMDLEYNMLKDL